jgi:hypothetical protein
MGAIAGVIISGPGFQFRLDGYQTSTSIAVEAEGGGVHGGATWQVVQKKRGTPKAPIQSLRT